MKSESILHRVTLQAPVVAMVLAATAIPVELRSWSGVSFGYTVEAVDVVANIVGYVPVGIVFGELGLLRATAIAGLLTTFAESIQFFSAHRDPSVVDIAMNLLGGLLGAIISRRWRIRTPVVTVSRWKACIALMLSIVVALLTSTVWSRELNGRGVTSPGILEARWGLDESNGSIALDSSGNGLTGRFRREPARVTGMLGGAVAFSDATNYLKVNDSSPLRLSGSMTLSAWINSSSYPYDDAVIVSLKNAYGYQLDTTIDKGPRTIGFKLMNACGELMMRYGATPLVINTWYHLTGVYDAQAKTMDVYLNGKPDNGPLVGLVTRTQRSSRSPLFIGRRAELSGFDFSGSVDDVRIYSTALTTAEIVGVMHGEDIHRPKEKTVAKSLTEHQSDLRRDDVPCAITADSEDALLPLAAAAFGALVTFAGIGLWPSAGWRLWFGISLAAGAGFGFLLPPTLPAFNLWSIPLTSLATGASLVISVRGSGSRRPRSNRESPETQNQLG